MKKTLKQSCKQSNTYKPFHCDLKTLRKHEDVDALDKKMKSFLSNKPSKTQMNQLYDTTLLVARDDSLGEGWTYCSNYTRKEFDEICSYLVLEDMIKQEAQHELQKYIDFIKSTYKITPKQHLTDYTIKKIMQHKTDFQWLTHVADKTIKKWLKTFHKDDDNYYTLFYETQQEILNHKYHFNTSYLPTDVGYISVAYEILTHVGVLQ